MGLRFDALRADQVLDRIFGDLAAGTGGWVVTANLEFLRQAHYDPDVRELFALADLTVADGMPLVWASRLGGDPVPERVAGSNLLEPLAARAAVQRRSLFLLGGDPGVADDAAAILCARCPGLVIAGTSCPPRGFEQDPVALAAVRRELVAARPDVVLVCFGAPKQERFIRTVRAELPESWFLGLGITLSFLTGDVSRAPGALQRLGLEWVHRLAQEPRRLARRYLLLGLPFAARLGADVALHRVRRRLRRPARRGRVR